MHRRRKRALMTGAEAGRRASPRGGTPRPARRSSRSPRRRRSRSRRRSASPCSTTTARSGARSRCPSSSASSSCGWPRWPSTTRRYATSQPWKAAHEKDYAWLGGVIEKHYGGDDTDVKVLMGGILQAFAGRPSTSTRRPSRRSSTMRGTPRSAARCATARYVPMVELLRYLEANGFTNYIASGGDRDFMRAGHARSLRHAPGNGSIGQLQRRCATRRRARRRGRLPRRARLSSTTGP